MRVFIRFFVLILFVTSCEGEFNATSLKELSTQSNLVSVSVFNSFAPVDSATCNLSTTDGNIIVENLSDDVTDDGEGVFNIDSQYIDQNLIISCFGGSYFDESTSLSVEQTTTRALFTVQEDNNLVVATPFTEVAYQVAVARDDFEDIDAINQEIADYIGLDNIDIVKTKPANLIDIQNGEAANNAAEYRKK